MSFLWHLFSISDSGHRHWQWKVEIVNMTDRQAGIRWSNKMSNTHCRLFQLFSQISQLDLKFKLNMQHRKPQKQIFSWENGQIYSISIQTPVSQHKLIFQLFFKTYFEMNLFITKQRCQPVSFGWLHVSSHTSFSQWLD